jgi:hypothetical protein
LEDYRFYVRQYGYSRFETLLYAVPMEDDASGSGGERLPGGASRSPDARRRDEPVVMYLRDVRGCERDTYAGRRRVLTRFMGARWETAELHPLPQVDNDEVVGVFERQGRALLVTKHAYAPGDVQVVIGETDGAAGLVWTAGTRVSAEALCAILESDDGGARIVTWEPGGGGARLLRCVGGEIVTEIRFEPGAAPIAGRLETSGELALDVLSPDGSTLARRRFTRSGEILAETLIGVAADPIVAAVASKRYAATGARCRRVFLARSADGSRMTVLEPRPDGLSPLRSMRWDPRFEAVSMVVQA